MRPSKYKTEEERKAARREQTRRAVRKHRSVSNNVSNNYVSNNVSNNYVSNNVSNNYKLAYERLKLENEELRQVKLKYEELVEHNRVNEEYIQELKQELRELKDPEWY